MYNIWKRSLAMLLAFAMVLGYVPVNAFAVEEEYIEEIEVIEEVSEDVYEEVVYEEEVYEEVYEEEVYEEIVEEEVTEEEEISFEAGSDEAAGEVAKSEITEIADYAGLLAFAEAVNGGDTFEGKTVKLTNSITIGEGWTPIGNGTRSGNNYTGNAFKGTFDGQGNTISGLSAPLFGVVAGGTVQNVNLEASIKTTGDSVAAGVAILVGGTVDNVDVSGSVTGDEAVGGVVGRVLAIGTIKNCDNTATVESTGSSDAAGGIVGKAYYTSLADKMFITNCTNKGAIKAGYAAGGIAGFSAANVTKCVNEAEIDGAVSAGGIIGEQTNYGSAVENVNSGDITSNGKSGGIIGWLRYQNNATAYPENITVVVDYNINAGNITGGADAQGCAGGIVGLAYNQAVVEDNKNEAGIIKASTFAGGIVGGLQKEPAGLVIPGAKFLVNNNVSTTALSAITASCVNALAYTNAPGNRDFAEATGNVFPRDKVAYNAADDFVGYDTLEAAVNAAVKGDIITLYANTEEAVELPAGVQLDKNGFTADSVTKGAFKVGTKAELDAAIAAAQEGDVVTLTGDIDYGSNQLKIEKAIILDLGGFTLTNSFGYGGIALKNGPSIINGTIDHKGGVAAIKAWNVDKFEDLMITVAERPGKTVGGIVIQEGSTSRVNSIKNVTINGAGLTNGIETYNCGDAAQNVIGAMEGVKIDAVGTGMLISAPCGTATNCEISGGTNAIEISIKGTYSASLNLVDSDVIGNVYAHDEFSASDDITNAGSLSLTVDKATTGVTVETVTLTLARAEEPKEGVLGEVVANTVAVADNTYYSSLEEAVAASDTGSTITLRKNTEETVTIPLGVTYNKNGFTAENVTEIQAAAYIGDTPYATVKEAVSEVKDGETITLMAGTFEEGTIELPATLKNVTIKGAENKTSIIKNSTLASFNGGSGVYEGITIEGIVFDGSQLVFTCNSGTVASYKDWTITGCEFKNITSTSNAAVHFNMGTGKTIENFTFTNNVINGVSGGNVSGLRLNYVTGNVVITDNNISNAAWNAIQFINVNASALTIENNTLASGADEGILNLYNVQAEDMSITANKFLATDGQPGIAYLASGDVSGNYWGGKAPADLNEGVTCRNYYADEAMTELVAFPWGTVTIAYADVNSFWGESKTNAKVSHVISIYEGEKVIATASLNAVNDIMNGSEKKLTWHINFNENKDEYWTVEWAEGYPNVNMAPTKVTVTVDGEEVGQNVCQWNGPDSVGKIVALAEKADGTVAAYNSLDAVDADAWKITMVNDTTVTDTVTLPAGVTFNGNGKTINGTIKAGGNLTFVGATTVHTFNPGWYNNTITIGEGASLKVTSGRMTVSYGNIFNITGSVENAKTAEKSTLTPSLELVGGISFTGNGGGVKFNVTDAYVILGDSTTKNSAATGEFNVNFDNSIVDFTNTLKTNMPTASGLAPVFNFNATDSVVSFASHLELWLDGTNMTLDNTDLTVGGSFANAGDVAVKNASNFVVKAPIMSSHGGNTGSINVTGGSFELKNSNENWKNEGTMSVSGSGKLIVNDFDCGTAGKIVVDVTGKVIGDSVAGMLSFGTDSDVGFSNVEITGTDEDLVINAEGVLAERELTTDENGVYLINNAADLKLFAKKVNAGDTFSGKTVKLMADIDLENEEWTPIGYLGKTFKGTFDGGEHTIKNLKITKELTNTAANNGVGLFGRTDDHAVIQNLTIENVYITGSLYVGAVVGLGYNGNKVENVTVKGDIAIDAWWYAGVIGGNGYMGLVNNCHVIGNDGSYIKGNNGSYIGGIWGFRGEGNNQTTNCSVTNLDITGVDRVGGISGIGHYGNTVSGCEAANVTVKATNPEATTVGLIVGATEGTESEPTKFVENVIDKSVKAYAGEEEVTGLYGTNIKGTVPVTNFVAIVNGVEYTSLAAAVEAAQNGDTVIVKHNLTVSETIEVAKSITLDLNGKTINSEVKKARVFKLSEGCSAFTIEANGALINADGNAFGIVEDYAGAKITVNGGTYNFKTDGGCVFRPRVKNTELVLNQVNVNTNGQIVYLPASNSLTVNGGTYKSQATYNQYNYLSFCIGGDDVTFENVTIDNTYMGAIEVWKNEVEITNCNITVNGLNTAVYQTVAVAVNSNASVIIDGGNYATKPLAAADANGQGATHGSWTLAVQNSGGTMTIEDGTFSNGAYGNGTPSNPREVITIGLNSKYADNTAELYINGGTFHSIGAIVYNEGWSGGETYTEINGGSFTSDSKALFAGVNDELNTNAIYGGTYNAPVDAKYCGLGLAPADFGNGVYGVKANIEAKIGNKAYATLEEAIKAAKDGDTILLQADAVVTKVLTISKDIKIADYGTYTIDLIGNGGFKISDSAEVTFDNFTIDVTNAKGGNDGVFDVYGTLNLKDMKVIGSAYTGNSLFYLMKSYSALNVADSEINLSNSKAGVVYAEFAAVNKVAIENSTVTLTNVQRGFINADLSMDNVTMTMNGGDNGINGGKFNAKDSEITISDVSGRALTITDADASITGTALNFSNCGEGEIRFKKGFALTADEDSTIAECTVYADAGAVDTANINGRTINGIENNKTTVTVGSGTTTVTNPDWAAQIGKVYYTTLQAAVAAAETGDTVTVLRTIKDETVVLPASLKDVTITAAEGAVLKNTEIVTPDSEQKLYEDLTFSDLVFENSRIHFLGWSQSAMFKNLTVEGCTFKGIVNANGENLAAVHLNTDFDELDGFIFTDNLIDDITGGESAGVYLATAGKVSITNNTIKNVSGSTMVLNSEGAEITVTDNMLENWGKSGAGRAIRISNNAETMTVNVDHNTMVHTAAPEEFVKITSEASDDTVKLDANYWNGSNPYDEGILNAEGVVVKNYYSDAKRTELVDLSNETLYDFGQTSGMRVIEPWGLKVNLNVYHLTAAGDRGAKLTEQEVAGLDTYGVYLVRESKLGIENATQDTVKIEDIIKNENTYHNTKESGKVTYEGGRITCTFDESLYTYEMSDSVFVLYYVVKDGVTYYAPVRERNLSDMLNQYKDDAQNYSEKERNVMAAMVQLEKDVLIYRKGQNTSNLETMNAPMLKDYPLKAPSEHSVKFGHTQSIRVIEPWAVRYNGLITSDETYDDYGVVVYYDLEDTAAHIDTAEELLAMENAYVFSRSNGNATVKDNGDGRERITATYSSGLYTYQMKKTAYVMFYVKDGDNYYYGPVKPRTIESALLSSKNVSGIPTDELNLINSMLELYEAVSAYREDKGISD